MAGRRQFEEVFSSKAVQEATNRNLPLVPAILIEDEKATIKKTAYLTPLQANKLEDLRHEFYKRTGESLSVAQLLRLLIERISVDDLI